MPGLAADAIPGADLCSADIAAIRFTGNRVTRPEVMRRELPQRVGEPCSLDAIIDGLTSLEDLGLFRTVRVEIHAMDAGRTSASAPESASVRPTATALPRTANLPGAVPALELRYVVREKHFFLPLPRLSRTSDGEVRAGASLEWNNFLGRLHELKLTSEWRQEDDGQGRGGFVHSLDYDVPRFLGSDYGMSLGVGLSDRQVALARDGTQYGEGRLEAGSLGITLARWINRTNGVQGLRLFFGARVQHRDYRVESGSAGPIAGGLDLGLRVGLENRAVHRDGNRRLGLRYGGAVSVANRMLGSDFDWHRLDGWMNFYRPVGNGRDNLNVRLSLGLSDGAPYGGRFYAIGGGELLRGMEKDSREGDARLLLNAEYLRASWRWPALRYVLFSDVGNVWPIDAVDPTDLALRGGIGLRWKLESLSRKDLRLDLAWDPVEGRVVPYLATQLTF